MENDINEFNADISNLINPDKAGLLVVDVQEKLWPFIHGKEKVLPKIIQSIEVAGHLGIPILVTEQYVKGLGPTLPKVVAALEQFDAYKPMEKFAFSCHGDSEFSKLYKESGIETLAIVGIEAHVCVMQTALDTLDNDSDVFLIAEATGSRDPGHKEDAIRRMRDAGTIIGSVEMFGFEMLRTSKHPAFRKVQKVIM